MKKICNLFEEDEAKPYKAKASAAEAQPQANEWSEFVAQVLKSCGEKVVMWMDYKR